MDKKQEIEWVAAIRAAATILEQETDNDPLISHILTRMREAADWIESGL